MAIPCPNVVGYCNFLPCSPRTRSASKGVAQADTPPARGRRTEGSSLMRGGLMARNFTPVGSTAERYPGILSLGKPCNETVPAPPWHYSLTDIAYYPPQGYRCMIWGTAARRYRYAPSFITCRPLAEDKHSREPTLATISLRNPQAPLHEPFTLFRIERSPFSTNFSRGVHKMNTR